MQQQAARLFKAFLFFCIHVMKYLDVSHFLAITSTNNISVDVKEN